MAPNGNGDQQGQRLSIKPKGADIGGIKGLLTSLGYPILSDRDQALDVATLLQRKDLNEKVKSIRKLTSISGEWIHPISKQAFRKDAVILVFELTEEGQLRRQTPFEITRYVSLHGWPTAQGLFVFIAPKSKTFAVTAYTPILSQPDQVIVRRLLVDVENITRTDYEALLGLTGLAKDPKTIVQNFIDALPYKKVGEEFFANYHTIFQVMVKRMEGIFEKQDELYDYTQRFIGRIVFLYFLQRKEWLDKNKTYLKKERMDRNDEGLFDFLYRIFEKLNTDGRADEKVIPFLNGSLFEREKFSEDQMKKIKKACEPILPNILSNFDEFNFTVSESTPLDKEVAVDPELLGNIFESMLPESERGDKGTFYTHQEEMVFMAREGMRCYLERFPNLLTKDQAFQLVYNYDAEAKEGLKIEPKDAREIRDNLKSIKILDPAVGSGGFLLAALQVLLDVRRRLNGVIGTTETEYDMKLEFIENCLFGVDIEAEAIELARLRLWLTLIVDERVENVRTLPNLDYNLYRGDSLKVTDKYAPQVRLDTVEEHKELISHIRVLRGKFIQSHGEEKEKISNDLDKALRKLIYLDTGKKPAPDESVPFSFKNIFSDIIEAGGFDVILMNPPYIRQEEIGRLPGQNPKTYKNEIIADAIELTKSQFNPDKKSDISTYFHSRALSLLKKDGVAVVIASSKWLDVGYGAPLQEYLLKNISVDVIYESQDRSFSAGVNVIISIMRKPSKNIAPNIVKFVYFKRPYKEVSAKMVKDFQSGSDWQETELYRLRLKTQQELLRDGTPQASQINTINLNGAIPLSTDDEEEETKKTVKSAKPKKKKPNQVEYIGSKWGNVWLRAPAIYFEIIKRGASKLKRELQLKRGFTTGCNDYFILFKSDNGKKDHYRNSLNHTQKIEQQYVYPILRNPEDVGKFIPKEMELPTYVFYCRESRAKLKGTSALEYIKWAETSPDALVTILRGSNKGKSSRICDLETVKNRDEWYQLSELEPAQIFLPKIVKNRPLIPGTEKPILSSDNFYLVHSDEPMDIWLYLNTSIFRIFMELYGRIEAPAVQLMVEEYKMCPILRPMPDLASLYKSLPTFKKRDSYRIVNIVEEGPLELQQPDRIELDDLVLKELGFIDTNERLRVREELYAWLQNHVRWRVEKPTHAPKSQTKKATAKGSKGLQAKLDI